ncbi:sorting nexin-17-like isoform X2 [Pomacea canaliculata]|uniref:sorting nexin-17-like isoform X2 n=1 Tax=Pomacea canaliculata TaxID=400727 RepID=UPI000D72695E|nr:sorting nexin-17-like isoform X2 [Pomacea canaliculata]
MHFSIPDTQEVKEETGSTYTSYNIYINGVFHCSARYKQMRQLHDQLRKDFKSATFPPFPPKKLLSLTPEEVEERRLMLERYIQLVSQDQRMGSSDIFNTFLHTAQQESQKEVPEHVTLDVFLMNGHKITVNITSTDQTDDILEGVASQIEIPNEFVYYFGLFLVKKEDKGNNSIVRRLQDFESPYISLRTANKNGVHRIVLRKGYWDSAYDEDLMENKITMNLLYIQAVSDLERQWILATKEQLKHLQTLQQRGSKREYLRFARTLKYYGYMQFQPCLTDYPNNDTPVSVAAGGKELNFRVHIENQVKEGSFKITRMRCWRITTIYPGERGDNDSSSSPKLELSFEYLMSRDTLRWITITSDQAMLLSMCLQSMVDELIMKKQGRKFRKPHERHHHKGQKAGKTFSAGTSDSSNSPEEKAKQDGKTNENGVTENDAFEGIGDDDL